MTALDPVTKNWLRALVGHGGRLTPVVVVPGFWSPIVEGKSTPQWEKRGDQWVLVGNRLSTAQTIEVGDSWLAVHVSIGRHLLLERLKQPAALTSMPIGVLLDYLEENQLLTSKEVDLMRGDLASPHLPAVLPKNSREWTAGKGSQALSYQPPPMENP